MTNRASSVSVVPSGFRMPTCHELVGSSQVSDVTSVLKRHRGPELVLVERRGRSSRAARVAGRSTRSSGATVRTRSSSGGCRRRPAHRDTGSPTTCRRGPSSFSTIVNGRPACVRRMPARMPERPHPITTTGDAAFTSAATSSPHAIAPLSAPSNCMSSRNSGTMTPSSGLPARNAIISSSDVARQLVRDAARRRGRRRGREARGAGSPRARPRRARPGSPGSSAWCGSARSRIHDGSPVMCTSEHSSTGMHTSSSAAAIAASSSANGSPTCGFRTSFMPPSVFAPTFPLADACRVPDRSSSSSERHEALDHGRRPETVRYHPGRKGPSGGRRHEGTRERVRRHHRGGRLGGHRVATRLTEDAGRQVLLIEAGPDDPGITDADRLTDQMEFQATLTELGHRRLVRVRRRHAQLPAGPQDRRRVRGQRRVRGPRHPRRLRGAGPRRAATNGRGRTCCAPCAASNPTRTSAARPTAPTARFPSCAGTATSSCRSSRLPHRGDGPRDPLGRRPQRAGRVGHRADAHEPARRRPHVDGVDVPPTRP